MKKIIIFNWKMAPQSFGAAKHLFGQLLKTKSSKLKADLAVCPPFIYLSELAGLVKRAKIKLGAQDVFWENSGAYTGEISPKMLKNLGVEYVIIGHSERRKFLGETDETINRKVKAALKAGLKVVLCVGEPSRAKRDKRQETRKAKNYVRNQLQEDLKGITKSYKLTAKSLIIAYEPVWAIGAVVSDTPEDALEMIKFIKRILNSRFKILNSKVLYGGSVDSKNIKNFIQLKEIDGVLVGGASLKPDEVKKMIKNEKDDGEVVFND
jgi:triosephosphate isomerase